MKINWNESSTRRGAVGLVIFIVGLIMVIRGDSAESIATLLVLGKGVSDYLKFTLPDR